MDTPWVATVAAKPASRAAMESGQLPCPVPAGLLNLLDFLNRELPEVGADHPTVGLVDTTHARTRISRHCAITVAEYGEYVPVLSRGRFDLACGLTGGFVVTRLGHYAAHVRAPALAALLDHKFGTPPPDRLYTRAEKRERLEAEQRAAAIAARDAHIEHTLGEVARVLFGENNAETRERAKELVPALDNYRAALAQR